MTHSVSELHQKRQVVFYEGDSGLLATDSLSAKRFDFRLVDKWPCIAQPPLWWANRQREKALREWLFIRRLGRTYLLRLRPFFKGAMGVSYLLTEATLTIVAAASGACPNGQTKAVRALFWGERLTGP